MQPKSAHQIAVSSQLPLRGRASEHPFPSKEVSNVYDLHLWPRGTLIGRVHLPRPSLVRQRLPISHSLHLPLAPVLVNVTRLGEILVTTSIFPGDFVAIGAKFVGNFIGFDFHN